MNTVKHFFSDFDFAGSMTLHLKPWFRLAESTELFGQSQSFLCIPHVGGVDFINGYVN